MAGVIQIKNRETLTMSEVSEVLSFDEDFVCALTAEGKVEIEGSGLKIVNMSSESGDMLIVGRIDGVFYSKSPSGKKGLFKGK